MNFLAIAKRWTGVGTCAALGVLPPGSSDLNPDLQAGSPLTINPTIVHADETFTIGWLTCNNGNLDTDDFHDAVWFDGNQVDVEPQNRLFPGQCDNGSFTVSDGDLFVQ